MKQQKHAPRVTDGEAHTAKLRRVLQIKAALDERKALYEIYDQLVCELQAAGFVSTELDGLLLTLVDNFAEGKNTSFTAAGVKRFDLKVKRAGGAK